LLKRTWATKDFKLEYINFEPLESVTLSDIRLYKTPTGNIYPSVTSQLGSVNKQSIDKWKARVGEEEAARVVRQAVMRGTRVHNILEKYLLNDDQYLKGVNPLDAEGFKKIKKVLDSNVTRVFGNEFPLYSDILKVAGRCDLLCEFDGKPAVVDFKTAKKQKTADQIHNYFMQAAAYCVMVKELKDFDVRDFHILIASEENQAQVFSGELTEELRDQVVDFFSNQYTMRGFTQESLAAIFEEGQNNVS
jgi:PD-(D/E)XK nuclease superfamily